MLINCPECGRQVSDQAEACPSCAYPIAKKMAGGAGAAPAAPTPAPTPTPAPASPPPLAEVGLPGAEPTREAAPAPAAGEEAEEAVVWQGTPSQLVNFKVFFGCLVAVAVFVALFMLIKSVHPNRGWVYWLLVLAAVPLVVAFYHWLKIASIRYTLTTERIRLEWGVLSKQNDEIELYRVKDISLARPLLMRLVGLGHVEALTSDKGQPTVTFYAVRGALGLYEDLRRNAEACRVRRGVREVDME